MASYDDGSFDLYICPECTEEYTVFEEMMDCWKAHYDSSENKLYSSTINRTDPIVKATRNKGIAQLKKCINRRG